MGIMKDCLVSPVEYHLVDTHTETIISIHKQRKQASRKADRLDLEYGAVRYIVKPIWANEKIG